MTKFSGISHLYYRSLNLYPFRIQSTQTFCELAVHHLDDLLYMGLICKPTKLGNPCIIAEKSLHPRICTVCCEYWDVWIVGQVFFDDWNNGSRECYKKINKEHLL